MTASYGYGISVTPLQILTIVGGIINGYKPIPTLILENQQGVSKNFCANGLFKDFSNYTRFDED